MSEVPLYGRANLAACQQGHKDCPDHELERNQL